MTSSSTSAWSYWPPPCQVNNLPLGSWTLLLIECRKIIFIIGSDDPFVQVSVDIGEGGVQCPTVHSGVRMGAKGADSEGNPFHSRQVTYCTDPDPLLMARELEELEEGEEVVANMFGVDNGKKVLNV